MTKQFVLDRLMAADYASIKEGLLTNESTVNQLVSLVAVASSDTSPQPILDDIKYLLQTLNYLKFSCDNLNGSRQSFIAYTKFYRDFICTARLALVKVKLLLGKGLDYKKLAVVMASETSWRNKIEHDIDPFYDGEIRQILNKLTIDKMVCFISELYKIVKNKSPVDSSSFSDISITYNADSPNDRKRNIERLSLNGNNLSILEMINELSYVAMNKNLNFNEKNIIDIGFKYLELHQCLYYTCDDNKYTRENYFGLYYDERSYFTRSAIITTYQIYDKLGLYLDTKYNLNLDRKYFKKVIGKIENRKIKSSNISKLCNLKNDSSYEELNKIRQSIVHGKKSVDFKVYSENLSTLIIKNASELQGIVLSILEELFESQGYVVSERAINEVVSKTSYKKL